MEGRPWIAVVSSEYSHDPDDEAEGAGSLALEFEWNERFIALLDRLGYEGGSPEEKVDAWFAAICAAIAIESDPTLLQRPPVSSMKIERHEADDAVVFR